MNEQARDSKLRKKANRMGYTLRKSRAAENINNLGGYMIVDSYNNSVICGQRFDLSLDEVEKFVSEDEKAQ